MIIAALRTLALLLMCSALIAYIACSLLGVRPSGRRCPGCKRRFRSFVHVVEFPSRAMRITTTVRRYSCACGYETMELKEQHH